MGRLSADVCGIYLVVYEAHAGTNERFIGYQLARILLKPLLSMRMIQKVLISDHCPFIKYIQICLQSTPYHSFKPVPLQRRHLKKQIYQSIAH